MKKSLLIGILLTMSCHMFANMQQTGWRWRADNGNETTATWMAADTMGITISDTTSIIRLRVRIDNMGNGDKSTTGLMYGTSQLTANPFQGDNAALTAIPDTWNGSSPFIFAVSNYVADGTPTTTVPILFKSGSSGDEKPTWTQGVVESKNQSFTVTLNFHTEIEYCIKPTKYIVPGTYYFFPGGSSIESYPQAPNKETMARLTFVAAPKFVSGTAQSLNYQNETTMDINSLCAISDLVHSRTLTWTVLTPPAHGSLTGFPFTASTNMGTVTPTGLAYIPLNGYAGNDPFVIQVSDGLSSVNATITVKYPNEAPVLQNGTTQSLAVNLNTATPLNDLLKASDGNIGQTLTWSVVGPAKHGSVTGFPAIATSTGGLVIPAGLIYTPANGYGGEDSITVQCSDGADVATTKIVFSIPNSAPEFTGGSTQTLSVLKNSGAALISSLLGVTDKNTGQTITWTVLTAPSHGALGGFMPTVSLETNGGEVITEGFTYTPVSGFSGNDSFVIKASDGITSDTTVVQVTVQLASAINSVSGQLSGITISPNPADDYIDITSLPNGKDYFDISIINLSGQVMKKAKVSPFTSKATVPVDDLEKGVYIVEVKCADGTVRQKMIKR